MRHDALNATQQRGRHTAIPAQKKVRKPINQLVRENNQAAGKTWKWSYDNAGNILSKAEYAYTTGTLGTALDTVNYTYGDSAWGDLLTSYNGNTIDYEENSGNPTGDGTWTYTWEHGRQLASMSNGTTAWSFTYDANGMRTSRSSSTVSYTYVYNGGQLSKMTYSGLSDVTMYFTYDASGRPAVVTYDDVPYYYVTNLQGDVVAILNSAGTAVVQYTYDAWGKLLSTTGTMASTLGAYNPLRYRSYVYDAELGLYYLQSRYYNPTIGRFLNADALVSTGQGVLGNNMFAYCRNNPVTRVDFSGTWDVDCFDSDGNPITDEKEMWGRSSTGGGTGTPSAGQNNSGGSKGGSSGGQNGGGTPIYRYGGTSKNNLVPTDRDVAAKTKNGLSFSTKWKPGAAMTTVESVNATGMFVANIDDSCHVTVYPIGITVSEWHDQGIDSPWTQALAQIVSLS